MYRTRLDSTIKTAVKSRKTVAEFFETYEIPQEKLEEILTVLKKEIKDMEPLGGVDPGAAASSVAVGGGPGTVETSPLDCSASQFILDSFVAAGMAPDDEDATRLLESVRIKVASNVTFISQEGLSEDGLKQVIMDSHACKVASSYTALVVDSKLTGESRTAPHVRVPPLPDDYLLKVTSAFTKARGQSGHLSATDMAVFADASKSHGNTFSKLFQDEDGQKVKNSEKIVMLIYDQGNAMARRRATRTVTSLKMTEKVYLFTNKVLKLPRKVMKTHADVSKTNEADVMGLIQFASWVGPKAWHATFQVKKEIFGNEFRTLAGGPTQAQVADEQDIAVMDNAGDDVWADIPKVLTCPYCGLV